jgi:hypothetical protein
VLADLAGAAETDKARVRRFFSASRCMQPARGHEWLSLLAGWHRPSDVLSATSLTPSGHGAWSALPNWAVARSPDVEFDLLPLYGRWAEALRLRAHGHDENEAEWRVIQGVAEQKRTLTSGSTEIVSPGRPARWPGPRYHREADEVDQALDGLKTGHMPEHWPSHPRAWLAHTWVVWVALVQNAGPSERQMLFDSMQTWADDCAGNDAALKADLSFAVLRERLNDVSTWAHSSEPQRLALVKRLAGSASMAELRWLIPLRPEDTWAVVALAGNDGKDTQARFHWTQGWRPTAPSDAAREPPGAGLHAFSAWWWPSIAPDEWSDNDWIEALLPHLRWFFSSSATASNLAAHGLNTDASRASVPAALQAAWQRAWPLLRFDQRLQLLACVLEFGFASLASWLCIFTPDAPPDDWVERVEPLPGPSCLAAIHWANHAGVTVTADTWNHLPMQAQSEWKAQFAAMVDSASFSTWVKLTSVQSDARLSAESWTMWLQQGLDGLTGEALEQTKNLLAQALPGAALGSDVLTALGIAQPVPS